MEFRTVQGGAVAATTFAIAFPDSVSGLVISGFQLREGTRGDLFILQLTSSRGVVRQHPV